MSAQAAYEEYAKDRAHNLERSMRNAREAFLAGYEAGARVDPFVGLGCTDCKTCVAWSGGAICPRPHVRDGDRGGCIDGALLVRTDLLKTTSCVDCKKDCIRSDPNIVGCTNGAPKE